MDLGFCDRLNQLNNARERQDLIELSMCDPPRFGFRPDESILKVSEAESLEQGYPGVQSQLVQGLVKRTKEFTEVKIDESDVLITNGLGGAFAILSIALRGESVGIESPFYAPIYEYQRRTSHIWFYRCTPELEWAIDFELLRKELEQRNKPGFLFLVTPSNPTGNVHDERALKRLVDLAGEFGQILVTDEVYDEMSFVPFTSLLSVAGDVPVIYLHGFSKVWRAPQIRVGYMMFHDPANKATAVINDIKSISRLGFGVNPHSQLIATRLLEETKKHRRRQIDEIRRRRDVLNDAIRKSDNLKSVQAEGATYQFVETPWNDWDVCTKLVSDHNILVTPASVFDQYIGDRYLRVVFLNTPERLSKFVNCLDELF
ncbi:MAG: pyridoxal phosphate-dependent aminotransferase [Candidatus Thorarchaeota archaeon]|nr:MAG: pyridoxal phosphate-dependent aminotransferase [Candidatus Thorarchaeota archaeon]